MDLFDNSDWRSTKLLLSCFGAWPFQSLRFRRIARSVVSIFIASIFIPEIFRLIMVRNDLTMVIECVPIFSLHLLTITKMSLFLFNIEKIKELLLHIKKDWQRDLLPDEIEIVQNDAHKNRMIANIYIYYIYAVTVIYMFTPMIPKILDYIVPLNGSRLKIALYQTEYFVDSEIYEIPMYIHAYIITPFPTTIVVAFDSLYANCVHHGCSMFKIVGYRLKNFTKIQNRHKKHENTLNIHRHQLLIKCIREHKKVLEYVRFLETTYSMFVFAILGINMLAMSITGVQTMLKFNQPSEAIRFGAFTIGQVIHLLFLCWSGEKLMQDSGHIFESVYQSEWYTLPPNLRRYCFIIMMRARRQFKLTGGKIYTMSLQNFGQVVKTSMSYCTVFLSTR